MKALTIINDNRITGIVYGMVEINQPITTIKHNVSPKSAHAKYQKTKHTTKKNLNIRANIEPKKMTTVHQPILTVTLPTIIELEPFYVFSRFTVKQFRKIRDKKHTRMLHNKRTKKYLLQTNTFYKTRKNLDAIFETIAKEKVK